MNYRIHRAALEDVLGEDAKVPGASAYVRHEIACALFDVLAGKTPPLVVGAPLGWYLDHDTLTRLLKGPGDDDPDDHAAGDVDGGAV